MIRVDCAAPEIHQTMTAARAKPQFSGPDEFSAPTGSNRPGASPTGLDGMEEREWLTRLHAIARAGQKLDQPARKR
jgi:hypothetical protein